MASRLQTGDDLKIIVFGEDALSGIYEISPQGTVSMPLIGADPGGGPDESRRRARDSLGPMPAANSFKSRRSRFQSLPFDRFTFSAKS